MKVAYDAVDEDEISAQVGDTIDVISKVTEDEGWWKVMMHQTEQYVSGKGSSHACCPTLKLNSYESTINY